MEFTAKRTGNEAIANGQLRGFWEEGSRKADVGQNSKLDSRSKGGISIEIKTVGLRGEAGAVKKMLMGQFDSIDSGQGGT